MSPKEAFNEAVGGINSAVNILSLLPKYDSNLKVDTDINPIGLIVKLLVQIVGYDKVVSIVGEVLSKAHVVVEPTIKAAILTQLGALFGCSDNPLITREVIEEGILFDLKSIDLANIFYYCPIPNARKNNYGRYYYFGCDDMRYPEDLKYATDMNAFLWYAVNRSYQDRCVWYGSKLQPDPNRHTSKEVREEKQSKDSGLVTIEYSPSIAGLKKAEGGAYYPQVPHGNCLHVFIGNTKPVDNTISHANDAIMQEVRETEANMSTFEAVKVDAKTYIDDLKSMRHGVKDERLPIGEATESRQAINDEIAILEKIIECIDENKAIGTELAVLDFADSSDGTAKLYELPMLGKPLTIPLYAFTHTMEECVDRKKELLSHFQTHDGRLYRKTSDNYYFMKPLMMFNAQYLFSTEILNGRTLVAELLDALTGAFTYHLDLSFEERLMQNEIMSMVDQVIATDTAVVNDCFFAFSNDRYNELVERTEGQRLGAYVSPDNSVGEGVDLDSIMESLNSISPDATADEQKDVFTTMLVSASKSLNRGGLQETENTIDASLESNFMNHIVDRLIYVIVRNMLTPKIYLLLAINMKLMGEEVMNTATVMREMKNLIVGIVREIRDTITKMLYDVLMDLVGNLAKLMGAKLTDEQFKYYTSLLSRCVDCFMKMGRGTEGWQMDDVNYADILNETDNNTTNTEC